MYWYDSRARTNLGGPDSVPAGCAVMLPFACSLLALLLLGAYGRYITVPMKDYEYLATADTSLVE